LLKQCLASFVLRPEDEIESSKRVVRKLPCHQVIMVNEFVAKADSARKTAELILGHARTCWSGMMSTQ
jgi:hypothetical protein